MEIIENVKKEVVRKSSQLKAWEALMKKHGANYLIVCKEDETLSNHMHSSMKQFSKVVNKEGFVLEWKTDEDNLYVYGDGAGEITTAVIYSDNPIYLPDSIAKMNKALKAYHEINANPKKYFHKFKPPIIATL